MSMPVSPGGSRGGPMLEDAAQQAIAATRQQPRYVPPPGYEPIPLSPEEKAEADKTGKQQLCTFCGAEHALPSTPACPRLASIELDGDGKVKAATFWPGTKWAKGRAVFAEDLEEGDDADGS